MKVQLLLLLALVGPFCTFSHASPTEIPRNDVSTILFGTETTDNPAEALTDKLTVIGEARTAAPELVTEISETDAPAKATETPVTQNSPELSTEFQFTTASAEIILVPVSTIGPVLPTEAQPAETDSPAKEVPPAETAAPAASAAPEAAEHVETESPVEVVVEDDTQEGLTSGQVAGIVIGALVAVVIVIAVVVALVRRMGKYSP